MNYIYFILGAFAGVMIMSLVSHFKDDYKQGYLAGFKRGRNFEMEDY